MHVKGMKKFREKLPSYEGKRIYFFLILAGLASLLEIFIFVIIDILPRLLPFNSILFVIEPLMPFLGTLICGVVAMFLVFNIWHKRDTYLKKSKELAYQRALIFGAIGIPLVMTLGIHSYFPIGILLLIPPVNPATSLLSMSLFSFIPGWIPFEWIIRITFGLIFLLMGLLTIRRALLTFGIDYMALVYLYYPEESEIQDHKIYSILRHPTYFGVLSMALGGLFMQFSIYSIGFFLIIFIGFHIHLTFVEEKELISRFGESYLNYKKNVPALFIKPTKIPAYFKFLTGREKE